MSNAFSKPKCDDEVSGLHCILPAGHEEKHEQPGPVDGEVYRWSTGGADVVVVDAAISETEEKPS